MHTVLRGSRALTHSTFCMCLCLNVCTLLHAVQCKCSLVVLCTCAFVCVCVRTSQTVLYHTARRRPKWTRTPCDGFGQAETTHTRYTHTRHTLANAVTHTHTNEHTSTSWPNYTEMRNEMETNLPREPANLEGLKDTLAHRTHTHLHTYVSGYLDYQNIMFRYDIIWKRNLSAQVKPYLTLSKLCHCIKLVW